MRRWIAIIIASPSVLNSVLGGLQLKIQRVIAEFLGDRLGLPSDALVPTMNPAAAGGATAGPHVDWYVNGGDLAAKVSDGFKVLEQGTAVHRTRATDGHRTDTAVAADLLVGARGAPCAHLRVTRTRRISVACCRHARRSARDDAGYPDDRRRGDRHAGDRRGLRPGRGVGRLPQRRPRTDTATAWRSPCRSSSATNRPESSRRSAPGVRHLQPGDHVVACLSVFCGHCANCVTGKSYRCFTDDYAAEAGRAAATVRTTDGPVPPIRVARQLCRVMLVSQNNVVKMGRPAPLSPPRACSAAAC